MPRTVLSRSLICAAVISVATVAVSVVPASAATPSGITREQVIAAAAVARADPPVDGAPQSPETIEALRPLINRACAVNPSKEQILGVVARATTIDDDAVGIYFQATIVNPSQGPFATRVCIEGAVAVTDPTFTLTGAATVGFVTSTTYAMSGDVFVSPARILTIFDNPGDDAGPTWFTVIGSATRSTSSTVTITTPKTAQQKNTAKKKYSKDLSSAKKSYKKAVKKAGHSKSKKAKSSKARAKKAYAKKRTAAKTAYTRAIATTHTPSTTTQVDNRPIRLSLED